VTRLSPTLVLLAASACSDSTASRLTDAGADANQSSGACWQATAVPSNVASLGNANGSAGTYADPAVSAACSGGTFTMTSNGIPTWEFVSVTPNGLSAKAYTFRLPTDPALTTSVTGVPLGGPIGVTVTGLPIFGPTEAPAMKYRDPTVDGLLDACEGHTAPMGTYHMHAKPTCLIAQLGGERHGLVVGFAFDGFPILAPTICTDAACTTTETATASWRLVNGAYDSNATSAWTAYEYVQGLGNLDMCNGMATPGADYAYAYFATEGFPYFVGCYRGTYQSSNNAAGSGTSASMVDYSAAGTP